MTTTVRSGSATDVGKVRTTNQDVVLEDPDLFAVADGMGGHAGGEVAARIAVDSLRAAFQREPTVEGLRKAVAEANRSVWRQGQSDSRLRGMGTTLTATALVQEPDGRQAIALANVGDSRAYVFSRGQVIQITSDHSLAEERVRQGQLTEAEASVHPHRHILTRALGVSSDVDVDLWELHLHDGDRILLCSDGLTNEIDDARIGQILGTVPEPADAAKTLVQAALDHGGSDNVTCVVIDVAGAKQPPESVGASTSTAAPPPAGDGPAGSGTQAARARQKEVQSGAPGGRAASGLARAGLSSAGGRTGSVGSVTTMTTVSRSPAAPVTGDPKTVGTSAPGWRTGAPSTRLQAAELRRLGPARSDRHRRGRAARGPRLVTVRVVLFFVLLVGVVGGAYAAMRWYAADDWYVGVDHGHLAVYRGRPGGFLWFEPRLVDETRVTTSEVLHYRLPQLRADQQEPSLAAAKRYVENLRTEYRQSKSLPASAPLAHDSSSRSPAASGGATRTTAGALGAAVAP